MFYIVLYTTAIKLMEAFKAKAQAAAIKELEKLAEDTDTVTVLCEARFSNNAEMLQDDLDKLNNYYERRFEQLKDQHREADVKAGRKCARDLKAINNRKAVLAGII
ncbi:hypothetical protein [Marinomonas phage CPP1m]|uniref:Uncharacterized protein n=2 Tax=Murciavirus CPP1m TaxID=2733327 RepID=A0A1W5S473_9CAUD|nr:hypothetical protein HOR72_gp19 [Marinomonas phage CPP1m]ARB11238.1 hypothetical protein [Marinomonas phage CPP1m]ARB11288.1 hypothetical protein [Marinomonas phage CPG1g]